MGFVPGAGFFFGDRDLRGDPAFDILLLLQTATDPQAEFLFRVDAFRCQFLLHRVAAFEAGGEELQGVVDFRFGDRQFGGVVLGLDAQELVVDQVFEGGEALDAALLGRQIFKLLAAQPEAFLGRPLELCGEDRQVEHPGDDALGFRGGDRLRAVG